VKTSQLIFDDLMENVGIIYDKDGFAYARTDDIEVYLKNLETKLNDEDI
jgi:hypothetical protein